MQGIMMQHKLRPVVVCAVLSLLAVLIAPISAQETPGNPTVGACAAGGGYASGCDVNQDGSIDINDIQLTAGHWASSGTYTPGHTHWGETWAGAVGPHGLRVEHTASSGAADGLVGVSASTAGRGVFGEATATSGATVGVAGQADSVGGDGVLGAATAATGTTNGIHGTSNSTSGRGVYGQALAASGIALGVYGRSESSSGYGVYGYATAASGVTYGVAGRSASSGGYGLYGEATATSGVTYGIFGQSASTDGRGVHGYASASSGTTYGVYGQAFSTGGRGVYGLASGVSGATYGVYGQSNSASGTGLYGLAADGGTGTTFGVYGQSNSANGYGGYFVGYGADAVYVENLSSGRGIQAYAPNDTAVWGRTDAGTAGVDGRNSSAAGRGVYGRASSTTGVNYGVYGRTDSASGYGGYFVGNLSTTGTLSKAAGSFKIDHPLDPANQYLYHSFVESPDMMNIYNGMATLDAKGEASVQMPAWFEALNRDFRYQLTPIGAAMPNLYIAQEMQGNVFRIAGGAPGLKVSWEVTGIRHDAYANAHRIPVEEPKPASERGLYLHPTELGQPAELGLDYQRDGP